MEDTIQVQLAWVSRGTPPMNHGKITWDEGERTSTTQSRRDSLLRCAASLLCGSALLRRSCMTPHRGLLRRCAASLLRGSSLLRRSCVTPRRGLLLRCAAPPLRGSLLRGCAAMHGSLLVFAASPLGGSSLLRCSLLLRLAMARCCVGTLCGSSRLRCAASLLCGSSRWLAAGLRGVAAPLLAVACTLPRGSSLLRCVPAAAPYAVTALRLAAGLRCAAAARR